jgi:hypothetical protein
VVQPKTNASRTKSLSIDTEKSAKKSNKMKLSESELERKLVKTQFELDQFHKQRFTFTGNESAIFRSMDSSSSSIKTSNTPVSPLKNTSKSEIYFEFVKDTFFYYITAETTSAAAGGNARSSKAIKSQHLKTIIDLFQYNEQQLAKINEALQKSQQNI